MATGGAFLLGIPIAGILATKVRPACLMYAVATHHHLVWSIPLHTYTRNAQQVNLKLPLYIAAGICAFNILYISAFLPESLPPAKRRHDAGLHVRFRRRACVVGTVAWSSWLTQRSSLLCRP